MKPVIAIPAIAALLYRAWSRRSLTPLGLVVAGLTASAHAVHPWSAPFALLGVFYLGGSRVTRVKEGVKARLTLSATGAEGGEGPRTHIQVLANSIVATGLILLHARLFFLYGSSSDLALDFFSFQGPHTAGDLLTVGIVANYAAVAADTFSSELGILSKSSPRLITSPTLRVVPPGTNGGVTLTGLLAGALGAALIGLTSAILIPFSPESSSLVTRAQFTLFVTIWGTLGSLLDSVLGGLLQASVVDKRSGKIVEGSGGKKVLIHPSSTKAAGTADVTSTATATQLRATEAIANTAALKGSRITGTSAAGQPARPHEEAHESRRVESGADLLDNNGVNVLMAAIMSFGAIGVTSWLWEVPIGDILA
ncbi:hypothetical protein ASPZODRAFT_127162 [Penicilliopsis zonata CBS 506.65]|uniref:TIGR00297 family protein n=1 Tax=Penicilliopsis zonata CBS 506.65 TaxID=1073090 RepID=A0A1L9SV88_9EURO|nr:hypothetical protein ASPZODRAFT_127162 [Penicilliopsis zonata CBS 506.65]OJJ51140.1 hypothetical protein ASPZODRAFT_127162 [Penicilliopsis zonata CBS 506.65]